MQWFSWRNVWLALIGWLLWHNVGCNASGYEPGPATTSVLPFGDGVFQLGEAKRTLLIRGMKSDGTKFPSVDELTYTSDPGVAWLARAQAQQGVEGQRWDKAILAMERTAETVGALANQVAGLYMSYQAARPQPAPPSANAQAIDDAKTAAIIKALEAINAKLDATKPSP